MWTLGGHTHKEGWRILRSLCGPCCAVSCLLLHDLGVGAEVELAALAQSQIALKQGRLHERDHVARVVVAVES